MEDLKNQLGKSSDIKAVVIVRNIETYIEKYYSGTEDHSKTIVK